MQADQWPPIERMDAWTFAVCIYIEISAVTRRRMVDMAREARGRFEDRITGSLRYIRNTQVCIWVPMHRRLPQLPKRSSPRSSVIPSAPPVTVSLPPLSPPRDPAGACKYLLSYLLPIRELRLDVRGSSPLELFQLLYQPHKPPLPSGDRYRYYTRPSPILWLRRPQFRSKSVNRHAGVTRGYQPSCAFSTPLPNT